MVYFVPTENLCLPCDFHNQTKIIYLNIINWKVSVVDMKCVLCEVGTDFVYRYNFDKHQCSQFWVALRSSTLIDFLLIWQERSMQFYHCARRSNRTMDLSSHSTVTHTADPSGRPV